MKIIGLLAILISLYTTWNLFNGGGAVVPEAVHMQIQKGLSDEIVKALIEKNPDAYNIEISKLWTESVNTETVRAHFNFSFEAKLEDGEESKFTKYGMALVKKSKEESGVQYWNATDITVEGQKIEFKEGLTFTEG